MNAPHPGLLTRRHWLVAAAATLSGCGGVDTGGTGSAPTYSAGVISGFGSVIVNDVRFDVANATLVDDEGRSVPASALRLGMYAEVVGTGVRDAGGTQVAEAVRLAVRSELVGVVESVNTMAGEIVVLGQRVGTVASTVFDTALSRGLASLSIGDAVEVWGAFDPAAGRYVASRIERRPDAARHKLRGIVTAVSLTGRTVDFGNLRVDWSNAAVTDPASLLQPGRIVRVSLKVQPASTTPRVALAIASGQSEAGDRDRAELEGRITRITSPTAFDVDGLAVDATAADMPGGTAGLVLGAKVKVRGSLRSGVLRATVVNVESDDAVTVFEATGAIQAVDAAAQSFTVRGVTLVWDASTRFEAGSARDLVVGRRVEAKGRLSSDGSTLVATLVHFED